VDASDVKFFPCVATTKPLVPEKRIFHFSFIPPVEYGEPLVKDQE